MTDKFAIAAANRLIDYLDEIEARIANGESVNLFSIAATRYGIDPSDMSAAEEEILHRSVASLENMLRRRSQ